MNSNREPDFPAAAELLAWHWTEDRPYFTLNGGTSGAGLQAWLRRPDDADLELHWSRLTPWRCTWMQALPMRLAFRRHSLSGVKQRLAFPTLRLATV
jgi:hypothetical protein